MLTLKLSTNDTNQFQFAFKLTYIKSVYFKLHITRSPTTKGVNNKLDHLPQKSLLEFRTNIYHKLDRDRVSTSQKRHSHIGLHRILFHFDLELYRNLHHSYTED